MRKNALVLDGDEVKLRLQAKRLATGSSVHVDWLRFTIQRRNVDAPSVDDLFPLPQAESDFGVDLDEWVKSVDNGVYVPRYSDNEYRENRRKDLMKVLSSLSDADFAPSVQAKDVALKVAKILGPDFILNPDISKGQDFYRFKWSITRNGKECAWVGFLASGNSPHQSAQANTIHVNITGTACTFADPLWHMAMADFIKEMAANITRCDLALDFFDGIDGGMNRIKSDYETGLMKSRGHQPSCNMVGNWTNTGHSRSFYIGSKQAGKQTNIYEKGDQLFGPESSSSWHRIELRYGNKLRDLPVDMITRPGDFFADASEWHTRMFYENGSNSVSAQSAKVTVRARRAVETVLAEVTRNARWLSNTAAASVALAFRYLGDDFLSIVTNKSLPARLQAFSEKEISAAYASAFAGAG